MLGLLPRVGGAAGAVTMQQRAAGVAAGVRVVSQRAVLLYGAAAPLPPPPTRVGTAGVNVELVVAFGEKRARTPAALWSPAEKNIRSGGLIACKELTVATNLMRGNWWVHQNSRKKDEE